MKKRIGGTKKEINILTPEEVRILIRLCSGTSLSGVRGRALIAVLYGAGLRIAEALALRPRDVDTDRLEIRVHHGKGGKARTAAIEPGCATYLDRWLEKRKALGIDGRLPVFCTVSQGTVHVPAEGKSKKTRQGGPLHPNYVRAWFGRLAEKAKAVGIEKRLHPHGLRHSHADQLRRVGWDMEEIRKQLGHKSLEVTSRYLDHIGAVELSKKMQGEDWGVG